MYLVCYPFPTARGRSDVNASPAVRLHAVALAETEIRRSESATQGETDSGRHNLYVDGNQALSHYDLGRVGSMHSGAPHHGIDASVRLGCRPDRARSGGVRRAGSESRPVPTDQLGSPL